MVTTGVIKFGEVLVKPGPINPLAETLALITGVKKASDMRVTDKLRILILGEPGDGKSWFACTGRKPILMYVFDGRENSISGKVDITVKTLNDADDLQPTAWATLESDVNTLVYLSKQNKLGFKTIVLDPLTYLLEAARNQMMKDIANTSRSGKIGIETYKISQGWDSINFIQAMVMRLLDKLFSLDCDIIMTAHVGKEKAKDYTEKNPTFTGRITITPQNMQILFARFNDRFLMKPEYKVLTKSDYSFSAVTSLKLDELEDADIVKMLVKHETRVK